MTATERDAQSQGVDARKRLTLDLDPELHLRIKIAAARANLSMREYLEEILRENVPVVSNEVVSEKHPISSGLLDDRAVALSPGALA